jgi:PiT family inorganic phosphate transporter
MLLTVVVLLIAVALAFDFINGFHDAANSIATVVSTRVLSPLTAVAWAAFFNFVSAAPVLWGVELKVAATMGKGIVEFPALQAQGPHFVLTFIFSALVGAIAWNLLTWWWGLPSSSSHALAGGMIGACLPALGPSGLIRDGILKIVLFIVLSPLIGMVLGSSMMVLTAWVVRKNTPARVDHWFRRLQLVSAAIFSYSHGTNDAQKVMGIITIVLYGTVWADRAAMTPGHFPVPFWVVLLCQAAITLGTLFGGWRIVRTMGHNLTKLQPIGGFCAETGGGVTILALAHYGIPVSTTHTITGAIVGVGTAQRVSAVRWGVATRIVWAWILTMPMAAVIAAISYLIFR